MSQGGKGGLTLPWLWVAVLIAFLSLGFMLPPLNKPMVELGKTKMNMEPVGNSGDGGVKLFFSDRNTGMKARIRRIVPVVLFLGLFLGVSAVPQEAAADESSSGSNLKLEWESAVPGRVVKIVNGKPERISFRIRTGEHVSRIKFGISRKDRSIGITISPEEVAVHEGMAGSIAEFNVPRGMPLGRHNLAIRVIEIGTDRLLGTGILPFILLPSGLECMC